MFPSNFSSLKRPLPAPRQESDEHSWHSSFKRLKVNEDHNNQDGDDNSSYNSQNNLPSGHQQLPAGQDSFEAPYHPQYPYHNATVPENLNGRINSSVYAATIDVPNLALNHDADNNNYQSMNSFLGQLHLQRRLQQQLQRQQPGLSGPGTPRTSNIHHQEQHQIQQQQQQQQQQQIQRQLFQEQQQQQQLQGLAHAVQQPPNHIQQFSQYFPPEAAAAYRPLPPPVRRHSADNPQQPDSFAFPSSSTMSSLSSGSPPSSLSTTTIWRPRRSKLHSDSKLF